MPSDKFGAFTGALSELGSVIYPKYITSEAIIAYVRARQNSIGSNVETLYHIFDNRVEAIEFRIGADAPVIGVPIMNLKLKDSLLIACINRGGKIIFPRGQDTIEPDDTVIIDLEATGIDEKTIAGCRTDDKRQQILALDLRRERLLSPHLTPAD